MIQRTKHGISQVKKLNNTNKSHSRKAAGGTGKEGATQHPGSRAACGSSAALEKPLLEKTWLLIYKGKDNKLHREDNTYVHIEDVVAAVKKLKEEITHRSTAMLSGVDADGSHWTACSKENPPVLIQEGLVLKLIDEILGKVE